MIAFISNTTLNFIVELKNAVFSVSFSLIFKIIFRNLGASIVILCPFFLNLREGTIK